MANSTIEQLEPELFQKFTNSNIPWISNVDLNNYRVTGFYPLGNNITHAPYSNAWRLLIVLGYRTDTTTQIIVGNGVITIRDYRNSSWTDWKTATLTNV